MTMQLNSNSLKLSAGFRMQWEPSQDSNVLLFPEGMVRLNETASEILKKVDGMRTQSEIIEELLVEFGDANIESDVNEFLEEAFSRGWVCV